jgi:hypothetical protein
MAFRPRASHVDVDDVQAGRVLLEGSQGTKAGAAGPGQEDAVDRIMGDQ